MGGNLGFMGMMVEPKYNGGGMGIPFPMLLARSGNFQKLMLYRFSMYVCKQFFVCWGLREIRLRSFKKENIWKPLR